MHSSLLLMKAPRNRTTEGCLHPQPLGVGAVRDEAGGKVAGASCQAAATCRLDGMWSFEMPAEWWQHTAAVARGC